MAAHLPVLGRLRREGLPRRQPAHEAVPVLGVADRGGPQGRPRRGVPRRGVHSPRGHARARQARLHAVLHVLHLEDLALGAHGVRQRARPHRGGRVLPAELLPRHARHPRGLPRARGAGRLPRPARAGGHARAELRHLLGLRALRERAGPRGLRGVPQLGEVRDVGAQARRAAAAGDRAPERDPAREPGAAGARQRALPGHAQRRARRLRQARARQHDHHGRVAGPLRRPGGLRDPAGRARAAARVPRRGPLHRRALRLAHRGQLRADGGGAAAGARPACRRMSSRANDPGHWFEAEPLWFKTSVFYEVHTRAFFDANGDGSGDFHGLTEKLDYLQWLGVDCIWLLPFFESPLRDGGYDISDFFTIQPDYGTVDDVRDFIEAAHQRGIRVIADLVMNHTSSDHPWFQESRSAPDSPKRDWYVWSDTVHRYEEARIIFTDTETSNWTWDEQAGAYFWHRFFSHQPDLNYDNPEVQEAMLEVLRFWLDLGLDGFRLDAVPYLFEREGTNGENLPETHDYLRRVRAEIDAHYPDRVLLAEANQWPPDAVPYFGDGDQCHMAFNFPVMPRMFMALRREDSTPIYEILAQTPGIPENCQWGLFLRNHDELTLEMVTDEERDYMYEEYAKDPRMKINVGIRKRLAPLLDNDGDEIAMGDNVFLGDRDGVRTPMQWTGDRNGGFSRADFAQLYAPPLMDPVYGYTAVNVEAQLRTPTSLLRWLRRFISLRKEHPVFGVGTYEPLEPSNRRIFAHIRSFEDDHML